VGRSAFVLFSLHRKRTSVLTYTSRLRAVGRLPLEYSRGFAETEDSTDCLNYAVRVIIAGHRLQNIYRRLQNLIDNGVRQRFDGILLRGIQLAEPRAHAFDFVLADSFEMLFQRGDRCFNLRSG
jgi:hypothetical protein